MGDDEAQVFDPFMFKLTLLRLEVELVALEDIQDLSGDPLELTLTLGKDQYVIHVHTNCAIPDQLHKDVIHHCLEGCRAVCQAKEHHQGFEQPPVRVKGGLPFVPVLHSDIVIPPSDVEFGEVPGPSEGLDEVVDEEEQVLVFHGD